MEERTRQEMLTPMGRMKKKIEDKFGSKI